MVAVNSAFRLVDGATTLQLRPQNATAADPIFMKDIDLGFPAPREFTQDIAGADGQYDLTEFFGSRTVQMNLYIRDSALLGSRHAALRLLRQMLQPSHRPRLYITQDGIGGEWFMGVRGVQVSVGLDRASKGGLHVSVTLLCASGTMQTTDLYQVSTNPVDSGYGLVSYPTGVVSNTTGIALTGGIQTVSTITNPGNVSSPAIIRFNGPGSNIRLQNVYTDVFGNTQTGTYYFPGLSLASGQYLQIDAERANMVLYPTGDSAIPFLDPSSSPWSIYPGTNTVKIQASGISGATSLVVYFRSRSI